MHKTFLKAAGLLMILVIFSGCTSPFQAVTQTPAATQTDFPAAPTDIAHEALPSNTPEPAETQQPTAEPTPTADPAADCPAPVDGSQLYVDMDNGFCLLYPADFSVYEYREYNHPRVEFLQPPVSTGAPEAILTSLVVEVNGNSGEQNAARYAERWAGNFIPGQEPLLEEITVDGRSAAVYSYETEFGPITRAVFVTAHDTKYRLAGSPAPGTAPALDPLPQELWELVIGSIHFFPPQNRPDYIAPETVCPQESGSLRQYINLRDGYCLLYPVDFTPTEDFPGDFEGGPVLEDTDAYGEIYASLTAGTGGYMADTTIAELLANRLDPADAASVEVTILGGYPAATFIVSQGPWASRQAVILVNGALYTLVNQPYEPDRYPEGMPYVDSIWNAVTGSLAFFDPWR
jgi:hypothetical protein